MEAKLYSADGTEKGAVELSSSIFGLELNEALLHTVITGYLANQRQGTAKTKGRSEVSGGGRKPYRQKGTGRARAGSNTSPIWVRGGKAHGTNPRDYTQGIAKKVKRKALLVAYSVRASEDNISVIDDLQISEPKTSIVVKMIEKAGFNSGRTLLILPEDYRNVYLSGRNVKNVTVKVYKDISAYDVMRSENVVFVTEQILKNIEEVA